MFHFSIIATDIETGERNLINSIVEKKLPWSFEIEFDLEKKNADKWTNVTLEKFEVS